jgi:hypothetical protein
MPNVEDLIMDLFIDTDFYESLSDEWIHFVFSYDKSNNGGSTKLSNKMTPAKLFERRTIRNFKEKLEQLKLQSKNK